ncbi:ejaculatory bulb-specific protein 3-like [Cylas formicarius]|uniref:ejaculatory bulb-specific protein 3-like n=1 Tax=Cylas formicarius TaxID=197179 RepID=UPI0029587728|nr:ejaculatory bulb-specific protein 3-like [Cylas formicarius]
MLFVYAMYDVMVPMVITIFLVITNDRMVVRATEEHSERVRRDETYSSKYDNVDVDAILASERPTTNYLNCLLNKGPCTPEGSTLKNHLSDAIATECEKCSAAQKKIAGKILSHFLLKRRKDFGVLLNKYDVAGNFRRKYLIDDDSSISFDKALTK